MILACAAYSAGTGTTDWAALAFFGVPLLGLVLGRMFLMRSTEPPSAGAPAVPHAEQLPRFPLARVPELGPAEAETPDDDLVGV